MSASDVDPSPPPAESARSKRRSRGSRGSGRLAAGEGLVTRLVATLGLLAIGVVLGAVLVDQDVAGWTVGLVVSLVSIVGMGIVWGTKRL